ELTSIEALVDTVVVEGVIDGRTVSVDVPAGSITRVGAGAAPSAPQLAPPSALGLRVEVEGPVSFFLTDDRDRSVGYHPVADAYTMQLQGAHYRVTGGRQVLDLDDPAGQYDLSFKAQGEGGDYSTTISTVHQGQVESSRSN